MKTAISIPDGLFRRAEGLARALGKSRSQLYREALAEYLARHQADDVTTTLDEVVADVGADIDEWIAVTSRSVLERSEW